MTHPNRVRSPYPLRGQPLVLASPKRQRAGVFCMEDAVSKDTNIQQRWQKLWANDLGYVFPPVRLMAYAERQRTSQDGHRIVCGLDWRLIDDLSSAFVVIDASTTQVLDLSRIAHSTWLKHLNWLRSLTAQWRPYVIYAAASSLGSPIEALQAEGIPIVPATITRRNKKPLLLDLARALESKGLSIIHDPILLSQLASLRVTQDELGVLRFKAGPGESDDAIMALALAWYGVSRGSASGISFV